MSEFLSDDHPAARVVAGLQAKGFRALLAGGAVRDRLLGRSAKDYDVATAARPDEVREVFRRVVPVGEPFGVVLVVLDGQPVEVATFRKDSRYDDGRRPTSVTYTRDPEEDALRRDFTVNALFLDLDTDETLDFTGGREDLAAKRLRCVGDPIQRFAEDRLRMLRAIRFAADLDFEIDPETWSAVRALAGEIGSVSGERVRDELLRMLAGAAPRRAVEMLTATGLMDEILPEVSAMVGVPQPARFHPEGDVYTHTLAVVERLESRSPLVALAALLHDIGKPVTLTRESRLRFDRHAGVGARMAGEICRRLRMSRAETEAVRELVRDHLRFMSVREMREAKLRRFLTGSLGEGHLALHRADCLASHGRLRNWRICREKMDRWNAEPPPPERLVTGRDLIDLGLRPGPDFAPLLGEVEDLTLEKRITTREEALTWLKARIETKGSSHEE
jgi:poly(A) polymerase